MHGFKYAEVSAKTGENMNATVAQLLAEIPQQAIPNARKM
jgi:hypothetical protein